MKEKTMARKKRDTEIDTIAKCQRALADLPDDGARDRAVAWLADKFMGINLWDHCRRSPPVARLPATPAPAEGE